MKKRRLREIKLTGRVFQQSQVSNPGLSKVLPFLLLCPPRRGPDTGVLVNITKSVTRGGLSKGECRVSASFPTSRGGCEAVSVVVGLSVWVRRQEHTALGLYRRPAANAFDQESGSVCSSLCAELQFPLL